MIVAVVSAAAGYAADSSIPERWVREVRRHGGDPSVLVDPLEYTDEMRRAARAVIGPGSTLERLQRLQEHLFDEQSFPYDADARRTLTAIEAFERRSGNCASFTNLFIALARSVGLPVRAALVTRAPTAERERDLIIVNTHVVAAYEHGGGVALFDFNRQREDDRMLLHLLDDAWMAAIYMNNRGAEELLDGNIGAARTWLEATVALAPKFAAAYGNLGVVRRAAGDPEGALDAYRAALEVEPRSATILNNLAALYQSQGRAAEARDAVRAARLDGATPFLLVIRGDFELADGNWSAARRLYRRAARAGRDLPEPWIGLARLALARNDPEGARRAVDQALARAPTDPDALALSQRLR